MKKNKAMEEIKDAVYKCVNYYVMNGAPKDVMREAADDYISDAVQFEKDFAKMLGERFSIKNPQTKRDIIEDAEEDLFMTASDYLDFDDEGNIVKRR